MSFNDMAPDVRAYALIEAGRAEEALAVIEPMALSPGAEHAHLAAYAVTLKALGRFEAALRVNQGAARQFPNSAVAWHNLGAAPADLDYFEPARVAMERAFERGLDRAETWVVYAHTLLGLQDLKGSERALRNAMQRQPENPEIAIELARVIWMDRGEWREAVEVLRTTRARGAQSPNLVLTEGRILDAAGEHEAMHALYGAAIEADPRNAMLMTVAAHARFEGGEYEMAEALLDRALRTDPNWAQAYVELASLRLAQRRPDEAFVAARRATELDPLDQSTWGWLATAARAVGGPAYGQLYDYAAFVRPYDIETPEGWPSLEAFLADLAAKLREFHLFKQAPSDQTLREGTQTAVDLARSHDPVLRALFQALDKPIRAYMAEIGKGADPLRARNTGEYLIHSAWSVLLRPNGFHVNHFHPMGWLSSAFYVEVPADALESDSREGWIQFGQPPFQVGQQMSAEHFVKPKPGRLVLFPSYMWHGTIPFTTRESRMTIAFDVIPR